MDEGLNNEYSTSCLQVQIRVKKFYFAHLNFKPNEMHILFSLTSDTFIIQYKDYGKPIKQPEINPCNNISTLLDNLIFITYGNNMRVNFSVQLKEM